MDKILAGKIEGIDSIKFISNTFQSCKGVVHSQIVTFIAAVCIFLASKYMEVKYPMINDVCQLMQCPFTYEEFTDMELWLMQTFFDWNIQSIQTPIGILQNIVA